jgi:Tol biopolymer transport system component
MGEKQEDLFIMRSDGTGLRQLTDDIYKDRHPRWAPDGKRVAFYSDRSGRYEAWAINSDGSRLEQLTYTSGPGAFHPIWSPDGTRLAYGIQSGNSFIIEVGKPWQEQSPQALPPLSNPNRWFRAWSWSPDGRKLAGRPRRAEGQTSGITLYSLEPRQYEKLTDFGSDPVWLSDNRKLLFLHRSKLSLVDSQSKKVHEVLSVAPHRITDFVLSRDDRLIYFSIVTTEADIWLLTL